MWETGSIFNTYGHMGPSLNIENHFRVSGTIFKGSAKSTCIGDASFTGILLIFFF